MEKIPSKIEFSLSMKMTRINHCIAVQGLYKTITLLAKKALGHSVQYSKSEECTTHAISMWVIRRQNDAMGWLKLKFNPATFKRAT